MKKILIILTFVITVFSQITAKEALSTWDRMSEMLIRSVDKMPAKHFNYSPIEPLADFAKLVNHTSGANYMFANTVKLENPKIKVSGTSKDQVLKDLEHSFKFIREGIEKLKDSDLNEKINWFGRDMTRLNAILTMTDHIQREYGKIITYLRLKEIAPARSGGW